MHAPHHNHYYHTLVYWQTGEKCSTQRLKMSVHIRLVEIIGVHGTLCLGEG